MWVRRINGVVRMKPMLFAVLMVAVAGPTFAEATKSIKFNTRNKGESKPVHEWGIDATWASWNNTQESVRNAGDEIDFVRVGFYMHEQYNDDGRLSSDQVHKLDEALNCAKIVGPHVPIMISPHNEQGIIDWYKDSDFDRWYHVMEKTRDYIESKGHKVVYVEAFNEPDYPKWNMGTKDDLDELLKRLGKWKVLRVGPSVMNCDGAGAWYDAVDRNLDAGSTHTLYGSMKQFINFMEDVKRDRKKAFCPELHSIAEAMAGADVGVDYMSWWGPVNEARANFMRACQGSRLAYVAVEQNWSAACVYRAPDGTLYGFAGANERENGITTKYKFVCTNEDATYYLNGEMDHGAFRKRGESFEVEAKPPNGERSLWLKIVPGRPE